MKATDMISKIATFMDEDKEVFAHIYTRDSDGNVISKVVIPLNTVFAHKNNEVKLCFETSQAKTTN